MTLAAGARFEHYEIESMIGVGGMGEVYRARDTKLERSVALKVVRDSLGGDPDRLTRFHREARLLAALNHSNIAHIYGVALGPDATHGIVMELVGGETLQARLKRGPLPLQEAVDIARQIAAALEAAHERGIIHRDLKPANVMVDGDGQVKVLDFGLGKALAPEGAPDDLSHSPTMLPAGVTRAHVLLGTAAYMSTEQARGKVADERSDIWAFGCVLYEMLTGKQAFAGETVTDLFSDILRVEPDWKVLPRATPLSVQLILKRCLQKDRRLRYHAVGDLRHDLEAPAALTAAIAGTPAKRREQLGWAAAVLCAVAAGGLLLRATYFAPVAATPLVSRFLVDTPPGNQLGPVPAEPYPAISPDGRYIVFRMISPTPRLWLRPLDSLEAQPIAGTEGVQPYPFWSADSSYIGFFAGGKLKKVAVAGGPPQVLTDGVAGGGTWNQEEVVLFSHQGSIHRVSAAGGASAVIRTPDKTKGEVGLSWPSFLPDGRHFLYVAGTPDSGRTEVRVGSLDEGSDTSLFAVTSRVVYAEPGHLLFVRDGSLMAQPFDARRLALTGAAYPIAESVGFNPLTTVGVTNPVVWAAAFSVATNGTLVYRMSNVAAATELTWFDRAGRKTGVAPASGVFIRPVLSPDQNRVVGVRVDGGPGDIWIMDVTRGTSSRFTFDPGDDNFPIFSPDGAQVAFASTRGGAFGVYVKPATGVGAEQLLLTVPNASLLGIASWSPDGRILLYNPTTPDTATDVWALPLTGDRKPYPVLNQKYEERRSRFSPDGRWILYSSTETGREEVYVQSFPPSGGKWQVSVNGADYGFWRGDGREIIFSGLDRKIMAVDVKLGATFEAGIPHPLFDLPAAIVGGRMTVTADAQRFLVPLPVQSTESAALRVVQNWPALRR